MNQKIFTENGTRLRAFVGSGEHAWDLKDGLGNVHFSGNAEALDTHVETMLKEGKFSNKSKKGKKKKAV